jgi:hypothetical protein
MFEGLSLKKWRPKTFRFRDKDAKLSISYSASNKNMQLEIFVGLLLQSTDDQMYLNQGNVAF